MKVFSSVQSLSCVRLFATPWTTACQASLSITSSQNLLKLMPIEWLMPSNHLILCHPLLLLPSIFPSSRVFSNESVLRIRWPKYWSFSFSNSPAYSLEGLITKLKRQYFGHLMRKIDSLERTLMLGKIEGKRSRGQQRIRHPLLNGITDSIYMSFSKLREVVKDREALCAAVHGVTENWTCLGPWTTELRLQNHCRWWLQPWN